MEQFRHAKIPSPLRWHNRPVEFDLPAGGDLLVASGAGTDLFTDPADPTGAGTDNAPAALFETTDSRFMLFARVTVEFASTFDAGVLLVRAGSDRWGKLCFEYSPAGEPMVVSVVTRSFSDDCNSTVVAGRSVLLRISRLDRTFAFHYAVDPGASEGEQPAVGGADGTAGSGGGRWNLVRYFSLGDAPSIEAGFLCQSPTGQGCRCRFSAIGYERRAPADIRSGE
ncbi:DUF1349 domain-containing protein [Salinispira pacifica]